jgi:hypothetical protein
MASIIFTHTQASDHSHVAATYGYVTLWSMDDLKHHILHCPGPFVTTRIVQRTAPRVQQGFVHQNCKQAFSLLQSMGLGKTLYLNERQLVYYKPLPTQSILHLLQASMKIQVDHTVKTDGLFQPSVVKLTKNTTGCYNIT